MKYLRWCIHEILERGDPFKKPIWYHFEVAMAHVVHEVNVDHIDLERDNGSSSSQCAGDHWE
jgi:hypothetical protein